MVAIGRLVMSTRERICAIEIEESGLLMTTLRTAEEVRDVAQMPDVPLPRPDPQMLAIAEKIVDQQAGEFDPGEFVDRYERCAARVDRGEEEGSCPPRPAGSKRRRQGDRPNGRAATQPEIKRSRGFH